MDVAERALRGDRGAFGQVADLLSGSLVALARRMGADREEARDVAQEALLETYRLRGRVRDPAALRSYILRAVANRCRDLLRRRRRRPQALADVEPEDPAPDPAARAAGRELGRRIEGALAALPEGERAALHLAVAEGMSHRQVGEVLDIPEATARWRVFRARRRITEMLEGT